MAHLAAVAAQVKNVHAHAHAHADKHAAEDGFDAMLAAVAPRDEAAKQKSDAVAPADIKAAAQPVTAARSDAKPQPKAALQDKTEAPSKSVPAAAPQEPAAAPQEDDEAPVAPARPVPETSRRAVAQDDVPAAKEKVSHAPVSQAKLPQAAVREIVAAAKSTAVQQLPVAQAAAIGKPALNATQNKVAKPDARLNAQIAAKLSGSVVVLDKSTPEDKVPAPAGAEPEQGRDQTDQVQTGQTKAEPAPVAKAAQPVQSATQTPAPAPAQSVAATSDAAMVRQTAKDTAPEPQPNLKALAAQIAAKAAQGTKSFEIRLDPAELGRVDVHLSVTRDGKAEATLYADRPETVALLQRDSQNLERALKEAGLDVSNSSLNFSLKQGERQGDGGGASRAQTRNLSDAVVARSEAVNASLASQTVAAANGRLDIRV